MKYMPRTLSMMYTLQIMLSPLFAGQKVPDNILKHIKGEGIKVENTSLVWGGEKIKSTYMHADSRSTESSLSAEATQKYLIWSD